MGNRVYVLTGNTVEKATGLKSGPLFENPYFPGLEFNGLLHASQFHGADRPLDPERILFLTKTRGQLGYALAEKSPEMGLKFPYRMGEWQREGGIFKALGKYITYTRGDKVIIAPDRIGKDNLEKVLAKIAAIGPHDGNHKGGSYSPVLIRHDDQLGGKDDPSMSYNSTRRYRFR